MNYKPTHVLFTLAIAFLVAVVVIPVLREQKRDTASNSDKPGPRQLKYHPWDLIEVHARSNAAHFGKPPEGWDVVCSGDGKYAPRVDGRTIFETPDMVGTNYSEAVFFAWRSWEHWKQIDARPPKPVINWKACE